jgi:hypothetical protein
VAPALPALSVEEVEALRAAGRIAPELADAWKRALMKRGLAGKETGHA